MLNITGQISCLNWAETGSKQQTVNDFLSVIITNLVSYELTRKKLFVSSLHLSEDHKLPDRQEAAGEAGEHHIQFHLLPSGRRYRALYAKTTRQAPSQRVRNDPETQTLDL